MSTTPQGEIRPQPVPTAFDAFADTTLAAIACNKAQGIVTTLLRNDPRFATVAGLLAESGDLLNDAMRLALQIYQEAQS